MFKVVEAVMIANIGILLSAGQCMSSVKLLKNPEFYPLSGCISKKNRIFDNFIQSF